MTLNEAENYLPNQRRRQKEADVGQGSNEMNSKPGTKCPMCGAQIDSGAKICGSCGESLLEGDAGKARRVRVQFTAALPDICAVCGEPATRRRRILFRQGRQNLGRPILLPVCHRHRFFSPRTWTDIVRLIVAIPFVMLLVLGIVGQSLGLLTALVAVTGVAVALIGMVTWIVCQSRGPGSPSEDSTHIILTGVAPRFARACEEIDEREAEQVGDNLAQMLAEHSRSNRGK
jgi:hypothetical protein